MSKPGDKEMHDASESHAQESEHSSQEDEEEFKEEIEKKAAIMRESGGTEAAATKHVTID
jgi:hypothetical protein